MEHRSGALADEHLSLQIAGISVDHGCHNQKDTSAADDTGKDRLQNGCCFCAQHIDQCDEKRYNNGYGYPGSIDIKSCHAVHIAFQESRPQICDDGWEGARLETRNTDVS